VVGLQSDHMGSGPMRRASAAIASGGSCWMPAATSRSPLVEVVSRTTKGRARRRARLASDFRSRSSKRKFEPRRRFDPGKCLVYRSEIGLVPNGPSEQPRRKPGVRERFRASGASSRCTAVRQKRPNSWASAERSANRESVARRRLGGRGGFELSVSDRTKIAGLQECR
jgi:hypothetical protein